MPWLLLVIVVIAVAAGVFKCSPEEESRIQQTANIPKRVEADVLRHIEEGLRRNSRALDEQENNQTNRN
jgi:hypothetical protein